MSDIPNIYI